MQKRDNDYRKEFGEKIDREIDKKEQAAKAGSETIYWIGVMGIVGWSVTLPLVAGIFLGKWIDEIFPGRYSFTLMLMFSGLVLGCWNAWYWVKKVSRNRKTKETEGEKKRG